MEFLAWFENTSLSIWVRETPWVFPTILVAHALGMGSLVGVNALVGLRALRVVTSISSAMLERFAPLMWSGFVVSLVSGAALLAAYPAKALTNPLFVVKFAFIGLAFYVLKRVRRRLAQPDDPAVLASLRIAAVGLLLLWAGAISAGRFLAYTHSVLLASHLY
jgi:hypothetical protein